MDILTEKGVNVGVMNVPLTYPAAEVNGFMVCGFLTPANGSNTHTLRNWVRS